MFLLSRALAERLFEVGVDAFDQAVRIDRDLEDANLVAEVAREIQANVGIEAVDLF